ncbi:MAG: NfeD family protein [Candidatus Sedimenticola endophacoides]
MLDYFDTHQATFWYAIGFLLLVVETMAFGLTTMFLLFTGIGGILTGLLMTTSLLTETWSHGIASFGITSALSAVVLWRPLKRLQDRKAPDLSQSSDLIGYRFRLEQTVSAGQPGRTRYSGIEWRVEPEVENGTGEITVGTQVEVVAVSVGVFRVRPA